MRRRYRRFEVAVVVVGLVAMFGTLALVVIGLALGTG